ncbi:MAG TPA: HD domain-containing phosphohydrolase [Thermoanaerobaculia bacterium]|nr:HD domain-containing phosphohydrolase [Thermoanaerobaculia bacterium]
MERLTLSSGITLEESDELVQSFIGEGKPRASANVVVGRIEAGTLDEESPERVDHNPHTPLTASKVDSVREAFVRIRREGAGGLGPMQEMIWSLIDSLSRSTREVLPLAPLKEHDEYTFVHSINVSLLVLAQARSFGISGDQLAQFGLAALVHDIGKLNVPLEVLNKNGRLNDEEWKIMTGHAELGAWHLAGMEATNPLAILVAYEHHLRYDGVPSYPVLTRPRRPNFASQMTSLADTYDAISTNRPYQKSQNQKAAMQILKARAGTFHDPFLVGNFLQLIQHPLEQAGV